MNKTELKDIFKDCKKFLENDGLKTQDVQLPQINWVLLLKVLDYFEEERSLLDKDYVEAIPKPYRWKDWAGVGDKGINGEKLIIFVNFDLFPALAKLSSKKGAEARIIIASAFRDFKNGVKDGIILRQIINKIEKIKFNEKTTLESLAEAYKEELTEWVNEAENNAYFFTPRPICQFIVSKLKPNFKKNEKVFDPASGLGGFLIESYNFMKKDAKQTSDFKKLHFESLRGQEKNPEFYLSGVLNLMLQGISIPNVLNVNSLARITKEIPPEGEYEIIMTNPSYNEPEADEIQESLPYELKTKDSALHFLFLVMEELKDKGRAAIILPNGPLFGGGKSAKIKQRLLENFNLHTIVRLPESIFAPRTGIETNILFFDKGTPTKDIWYYNMPMPERLEDIKRKKRTYAKTKPPIIEDFKELSKWFDNKIENDYAWKVNVSDIIVKNDDKIEINLDQKDPKEAQTTVEVSPHDLIKQILEDERKTLSLLEDVEKLIQKEIPK